MAPQVKRKSSDGPGSRAQEAQKAVPSGRELHVPVAASLTGQVQLFDKWLCPGSSLLFIDGCQGRDLEEAWDAGGLLEDQVGLRGRPTKGKGDCWQDDVLKFWRWVDTTFPPVPGVWGP